MKNVRYIIKGITWGGVELTYHPFINIFVSEYDNDGDKEMITSHQLEGCFIKTIKEAKDDFKKFSLEINYFNGKYRKIKIKSPLLKYIPKESR
jgi:hypothetical protein